MAPTNWGWRPERGHLTVSLQRAESVRGRKRGGDADWCSYVFENLEDYAFPAFIQERAFTNQSAVQRLIRLSLGLLVLWIALTVGFSCVFLDARRHTRAWVC